MAEITLSSNSYKHNFHLISSHIGSNVELAAVLKDNAYGHGLEQISTLARECGIKSVFVKNYNEALRVSAYFPHITALYGMPEGDFPPHIAFVINAREHIESLPKGTRVELKVNAGMNRNGIEADELESYIVQILERGLNLVGVFSHNGYGDDIDDEFLHTQERFLEIKERTKALAQKYGFVVPRFHSLSSSGAVRVASEGKITDDLVRIGIALYGYLDTAFENPLNAKLQKVARLYADRVSTRILSAGARIGYSGCTTLEKESVISTYDIGYGDGFFRVSEQHKVHTAKGYQILPRLSMDCFSCLCDEPRICVFDDVSELAKAFGTISYEILTHLSPSIKRTII
ncbi:MULTISPECIES: alanine racemase [Helicobacter]|uniref:Alanine racemase n=6 Tax=Helicobacter typhlonius TaxID=76936 RepID=A0A099UD26_9HELI|nr:MULTISPECIES: alanine racemase [Helicobacter]TLD79561.1 alanine racemase [Helicobacter typhlonius]TLD88329.1 alanine racemase [Helicobacter sp. MIT 03-1616]CUU39311.1 Alanine racemase [Helicobacter typhlonius]